MRPDFVLMLALLSGVPTTRQSFAVERDARIAPVECHDPATGETRPFFPIGWYAWLKPATLDWIPDMAAGGANVVYLTDVGLQQFELVRQALDVAGGVRMKAVIALDRKLLDKVDPRSPATYAGIRRLVEACKNHSALLGWALGDENPLYEFLTPTDVVNSAVVIHRLDPHHQVWQVFAYPTNKRFGTERHAADYMAGTDVVCSDTYVHYDGEGTDNPRYAETAEFENVDKTLRMQHRFARLSAVGDKSYVNVTQAFGPNGNDIPMFRFRTAREYRWNVFSAIASAGARGTLDWVYRPESPKENPAQWWYRDLRQFHDFRDKIVKPVFRELRQIAHAMETGYDVGTVRVECPEKRKEMSLGSGTFAAVSHLLLYDDRQHKWFLIVTNNTVDPRKVTVYIAGLPAGQGRLQLSIPRARRTLELSQGHADQWHFEDLLNGYDVIVYALSRQPASR